MRAELVRKASALDLLSGKWDNRTNVHKTIDIVCNPKFNKNKYITQYRKVGGYDEAYNTIWNFRGSYRSY